MAIPESFLQELVERNDIADVVSGYVKLSKRSGANLFGLCPFHSEKTPSFSVSPEKQIYHCFGCGKGGGVINFIMEIEGLSFPEAVEFLARRVGLEVPQDKPDRESLRRERMLSLNRDTARFFHRQLVAPTGKIAQDYVNRRGISPNMVKTFGLGFAPNAWDSLIKEMTAMGYTHQELFDAGLVRAGKKPGSYYDTFRNRLMFPVIDIRGNVIGFSGRILDDGEPKYMNSPETLVFNKGRGLFAINLAKKSKAGYFILAEGNVDVVSMHQAGFDSAVASLGTSLTPEQARLIARYTDQVVIAYDSDGAGQKASQRAIGILEKLDIKVRLLRLSGAKDPDEFIRKNGPEAFRALIEKSENHIEYRLQAVQSKYDLKIDEERVAYLKESAQLIASLQNQLERQVYAMRVAQTAGVSPSVVEDEVARLRKRLLSQEKKQYQRQELSPIKAMQPRDRTLRFENVRSAKAEQGVISLLYQDPQLFRGEAPVQPEEFSAPVLAKIYSALLERVRSGAELSLPLLAGQLSGEEMDHLTQLISKPEIVQGSRRKALHDYIDVIKTEHSRAAPEGDLRAMAEKYRQTKGYGV
ncbi:MAG: DNA primase [Candidatus Heteroscillospira sp.]|jgi:DNA primase